MYSRWFLQCCGLDGLYTASVLQFPTSFFQASGTIRRTLTTIRIIATFIFHRFFLTLKQNLNICQSFRFLTFSLYGPMNRQNTLDRVGFFCEFSIPLLTGIFPWSSNVGKFSQISWNLLFALISWFTSLFSWSLEIVPRASAATSIPVIIIIIIILLVSFSQQCSLMVFHKNLRDSKCPQLSRTLLIILVYLQNVAVWMVSIIVLIFTSSSPFSKSLGQAHKPHVPQFLGSLVRSNHLCIFSLFYFHFVVNRKDKIH